MSKKPAALPHIEDATFAACLAPLAGALVSNVDGESSLPDAEYASTEPQQQPPGSADPAVSGWTQQLASAETVGEVCLLRGATGVSPNPQALAAWRSLADQEFAEFCTVELFLAKTDAELSAAVVDYPRQIRGLLARIARIEKRRAVQQQAMSEVVARIELAMLQAGTDPGLDLPHGATVWGKLR